MAKVKPINSKDTPKRHAPPLTPESQENYMIALAMDAAEKQMIEGTASSQIIVHFLKQGTMRAELELEKLRKENRLMDAKSDAIEAGKNMEETYLNAINAMKRYGGHGDEDD